jgi:hypothetical protein
MSQSQGGLPAKSLKDSVSKFNGVINRTRAVDQIVLQMKRFGSLHQLWYYCTPYPVTKDKPSPPLPVIDSIFEASLKSHTGQAAHCMAFIRLLNSALYNVHRLCPEEQKTIGERILKHGQAYIGSIIQIMDECIRAVVIQKLSGLNAQHAPNIVAENIKARMQAAQNKSPVPSFRAPGFESAYVAKNAVAEYASFAFFFFDRYVSFPFYRLCHSLSLRAVNKIVSEISTALRLNPVVVVYNQEFSTREILLDRLYTSIRGLIRRAAITQHGIEQPTVMLAKIKIVISSFSMILNFSMHFSLTFHSFLLLSFFFQHIYSCNACLTLIVCKQ